MADIKACDKCGQLFTPRGPWQVLHAITFGRVGEDGAQPRTDVSLEVCSRCMYDPAIVVAPALPEGGGDTKPAEAG